MRATDSRLEIPTLSVGLAIYGGFALLTLFFNDLPLLVAAPVGALLLAWHSSFQHETIHGHPTASRRINAALATPPLALWIPYGLYRETHLRHHRRGGRYLTDPVHDPESFYLAHGALTGVGVVRRAIHWAHCSLAGRLLLGPAVAVYALWDAEARRLAAADTAHLPMLLSHLLAVIAVLAWVLLACHIPVWVYLAGVVYPSISLGQLRSFAEHRAHDHPHLRTAVVEASPLWALIFLNNNLHIAHHLYPKLPWYQLPHRWRQIRASQLGGGLVFQGGYWEIVRGYLFRPVITPEHPASIAATE